ncbi:DegV family protein [Candidatus Xianfuyuplasma coldseepsis]|uniref:DegV family protein n=1 Tax=Candidatus Xianfuyuplasma coldseepsis TaxID=2782163 RepID=A0A7L7KSN2_9MOLU|nr:DegV family protein [Xianfuyuplasma coldseepsis]QMS84788.1 DegV family protein [Xianfuyuplasma coldseepsis]
MVKILIDSTVYIPKKMIEDNDITVVSLNVTAGTETYPEVSVDNDFIWAKQDEGIQWKTSQPAPGDFLSEFQRLIDGGAEMIFCVLLSKNISGTFQSALLAKNMLDDPDKVHLFDTQLCAYGTEMIAVELVEMVQQQKSNYDIIQRITSIIATSHQMFTVENLFSLTKGGRLSVARAAIGTVLRIKPVIEVIKGKLELVKSERTYKKIHQYFVNSIRKSLEGHKTVTFYITSQNSKDSALQVQELLLEEFPGSKITFTEYLGPVFSIHVGKKGYGISWFVE